MRMHRAIKMYVEAELRNYGQTLQDIRDAKADIINAGMERDDSGISTKTIGRPTEQRAIKLTTNNRILHMERVAKAIGLVVAELSADKRRLVELKYWTRPQLLTDIGIARELHIGQRTLYRWTDNVIYNIALEIGLINFKKSCQKSGNFGGMNCDKMIL